MKVSYLLTHFGNSGDCILNWSEGEAAPAESVGKLHHTIPQAGKLECSDQIRSCIPPFRAKSLTSATQHRTFFPNLSQTCQYDLACRVKQGTEL